ncbi:RagB/SusD family nutrient uptake outer membrane protein [Pedobacter sp. B4-66]|uniref:RagB/SusD family nutrient uptake outer membrane protein n=1 Tax=Pedobacter sp. B4-66 TaxID=2817280 RepID=UPI001BD93A30|nr:RagB/SusD family nutrient uptake outer membrane protein [Pedobacter sp. B4-66]
MKKYIICLFIIVSASQYGCKKFLDITPIDKLTGNNFYKTREDMEANITDMYGELFDKYTKTSFAGATGEFRSGEVIPAAEGGLGRSASALIGGHTRQTPNPQGSTEKQNVPLTTVNDRLLLRALGPGDWGGYNFSDLTRWGEYYRVIQSANLLISKVEDGIPALTAEESKRYIAEAKFIRCLCYFQMVRLYGDVVYYTAAFQKDPLPRENMVSVITKCIADLKDFRNDLPATFSDPSQRGVRASRGAAIGLLMNMNMWNAGFDLPNRTSYYQETAALGKEIMDSKAFRLLPINEWAKVAKGRSEESLFELFRTLNYNQDLNDPFAQANAYSPFGDAFIHFPYKQPEYTHRYSFSVFSSEYMRKLYPEDDPTDLRLSVWFVAPFDQNASTFQLRKFALNTFADANNPNLDLNPDNTYLIMRYPDAILLRAEAAANLGNDDIAIACLNEVRRRAGSREYGNGNDLPLKDAIFLERSKELMGEGSRYFDLVRTKRVLSKEWTDNPLTSDKFNRGGWTWPIDGGALFNNPKMSLNSYWIGSGL